ncbi:hypothetical protein ACHAXS_012381 [Conticribra weissflogii]
MRSNFTDDINQGIKSKHSLVERALKLATNLESPRATNTIVCKAKLECLQYRKKAMKRIQHSLAETVCL